MARTHPVVLCPGLASNRIAYDLTAERSLARHFASRGYDVWVLELRGHGRSERVNPIGGKRWGWSFDDYLLRDLPAALRRVTTITEQAEVHYLGHSMGGLLVFAHLALGRGGLRSVTTVGSSVTYHGTPSDFEGILGARPLVQLLPMVPLGYLATLASPLSGWTPNPVEAFNLNPANLEPELNRRLHATCFHPVSAPVLLQLASAFDPAGLASRDGAIRYAAQLGQAQTPLLALAGDVDRQCSVEAVANTLDRLGSVHKQLLPLGEAYGQAGAYGHFDLLVGTRAPSEVWPKLDAWLDRWD